MRTKQRARMGDSHSPSVQRPAYSNGLTMTDPQRPTYNDRPTNQPTQRLTQSGRPTMTDPSTDRHNDRPIVTNPQRPIDTTTDQRNQPTAIDP